MSIKIKTIKKKIVYGEQRTVFVGLSGGVDSAVCAALLKKATPNNFEKLFGCPTPKGFRGYEVVGVFIKTWHPDFLVCNEGEERMDAMRVAAALDIPFLTFNFEDIYKKEVADYMIREYKVGRTPNPDVMCNKEVKFGGFLKKALVMGADYVATGHYANLTPSPSPDQERVAESHVRLSKGIDPAKDQSYFLWTLRQEQLKKILFPVGNLKKIEVRKLAKKFNLPVAEKKDSQGICFLGEVDLKIFLKHYIKERKGKVLNIKGEEIGYHDGAVFYTLGERHGFTIIKKMPTDGAYYIVGKDVKKNILIVSQNTTDRYTSPQSSPYKGDKGERRIHLQNTNWINEIPKPNKNYTAQVRYHGEFLLCKILCPCQRASLTGMSMSKMPFDMGTAEVIFSKPVLVAPGQSCVVYDEDICIGGGVVV